MRKPRTDSVLDALPDDQKQKLIEWLLRNLGYFKIAAMLKAEYGVKASVSMIGRFHDRWVKPILKENIRNSAKMAEAIEAEMQKNPDRFDAATIANLKRAAFDLSCDANFDPAAMKSLLVPLLKHAELDLSRAKYEEEFCGKLLTLANDKRVQDIAASAAPRTEQIAALRKIAFADVDATVVELPT